MSAHYDTALAYDSVYPYDTGASLMASTYEAWLAVLNQLAGTTGLGELEAANIYAGTTGMGLQYALNAKHYGSAHYAPSASQPLLEINLVCNMIAGTTNLEALAALNVKAGNTGY